MAELTVRIPGILLSSLMFQHLNSDSDVEGLLLGETTIEEQSTISDSQPDRVRIQETHYVQKHVPCRRLNMFYNAVGDVDLKALEETLGDHKQPNVIGWYRQRRNSEQRVTFREQLVLRNLSRALSSPQVVLLLLTAGRAAAAAADSTHRTEYAAFVARDSRLVHVQVCVSNLGVVDQLAYWTASSGCSAAGFSRTMRKHSSRFFAAGSLPRDVTEVNRMNESLQAELQKACSDVVESERRVEALAADVAALRRRAGERKQRRHMTASCRPEPDTNGCLQEAVRRLFSSSPLFLSQTLTLDAFPVNATRRRRRLSSPNTRRRDAVEVVTGRERQRRRLRT